MKKRFSLLLLVLACLLALVPGASAQDSECLNLSADDCTLLTTAQANSENVKSAFLQFAVDLTVGGLESFDPSAAGGVDIHITGQGPFTSNGVPDEAAMMTGDIASVLSAISTQIDMQIDVNVPGQDAVSTPFSFVIADGNVYFQNPDTPGEWVGMTGEAVAAQFQQFSSMAGSMGGVNPNTMSDPSQALSALPPELLTALSSIDAEELASTPGFLNNQRLTDEELMGQSMTPFQFTIDFGTLFKSPQFQQAMQQLGTAAQTSTDPDTQQAAQLFMVLPMFLQNTTATVNATQWVGSTDQLIHKVALDLEANIDLSMLAGMSGNANSAQAAQMQPITVDFHSEINFDQINESFDIAAPEGAQLVTPEDMGS